MATVKIMKKRNNETDDDDDDEKEMVRKSLRQDKSYEWQCM